MDVEIQGTSHRVRIARQGSDWLIDIGGQSWLADVMPAGDSWSVLLRAAGTAGVSRSLSLAFDQRPDGAVRASVDGRDVLVSQAGAAAARRSAAGGGGVAAGGPHTVKAPMPGRVVKVLVGRGEVVGARQPVVVLEAMKMQNDVRAVHGGRVSDVHVAEGALVEAASPLITILVGDDGQS